MRLDVITLFPDMLAELTRHGVVGRGIERGLLDVNTWNPRAYTTDNYHRVDARPFGGGPGMVMQVGPLRKAWQDVHQSCKDTPVHTVYLSPQGARLTQKRVEQLASMPQLTLVCGRYEGVDERFLAHAVDEELSIGDYVLSGGELAAAVVIDALARLQTGVLHDARSARQDSFSNGLLDCPHYTRPVKDVWGNVPDVLQSGDHAAIDCWRRQQALGKTWLKRPDKLAEVALDDQSQALLEQFRRAYLDYWKAKAR